MTDLAFRVSPNIILGTYATERLGGLIKDFGSRFMLIFDPILRKNGIAQKIQQSLDEREINYFSFYEIQKSDTQTISEALSLAKQSHINGILAVGGTKAINVGRAVAALFASEKDLYSYIDGDEITEKNISLICFPTTFRETFLFTQRIPLVDSRSRKIKILKCKSDLCDLAIFDPNQTATLTQNQTVAQSLEILCLLVEAYSSQKANFFSDMLVEKACEIISYTLDGADTLTSSTPKEVLLSQAGCLASLAIGASSVGAVSLLALAINARFGISRSLVVSILGPYEIEDCAKFKTDKLSKIASLLRICKNEESSNQAALSLAENMRQKIACENLPSHLKDLNLSMEQLSLAAEDAAELDLITTLPRSMTADDLFEIIKLAY